MTLIEFNDCPGSRGRETRLLVIADGRPYWFRGGDANISILSRHFTKDGKWSRTTYRLSVADGVRTFVVQRGFESNKWREGFCDALGLDALATWDVIAEKLGVPVNTLIGDGKVIIPDGIPTQLESETD